jgi:hypothetical protein
MPRFAAETELVPPTSRADLHCRSSASTPPREVYALAKERGMDFVTIADRDSIDGVRVIAERPDVFMSVELTARLRDSTQTVGLLCYGISQFDYDWLRRRSRDVEVCTAYLREHSIAYEIGRPAELHDGSTVGSDFTETPRAETPWEFLSHLRRSAILDERCGESGSSPGYCSSWPGGTPLSRWGRAA